MATYQFETPDGQKYELEAESPQAAYEALQQLLQSRRQPGSGIEGETDERRYRREVDTEARRRQVERPLGYTSATVGEMVGLGFTPEFLAGGNSLVVPLLEGITGRTRPGSPWRGWRFERDVIRRQFNIAREDLGWATLPGDIAGGFMMAPGRAIAASGPMTTGRQLAHAAGWGAGFGGVYGFGSAESGNLEDRVSGGVEHALGGAVAGPLFYLGLRAAGAASRPFVERWRAWRTETGTRARAVEAELQAAGAPDFTPATGGSAVQDNALWLSRSVFGGPLRRGARRSIEALEERIGQALQGAGAGRRRTAAEAGEEAQRLLRTNVVERSRTPAGIEALPDEMVESIATGAGVRFREGAGPREFELTGQLERVVREHTALHDEHARVVGGLARFRTGQDAQGPLYRNTPELQEARRRIAETESRMAALRGEYDQLTGEIARLADLRDPRHPAGQTYEGRQASYPTAFDAAYEGLRRSAPDVSPKLLGVRMPQRERPVPQPRTEGRYTEDEIENAVAAWESVNSARGRVTTARGSTYDIYPDGTTMRTAAPKPDSNVSGPQPRSVRTVYLTRQDAQKLLDALNTLPRGHTGGLQASDRQLAVLIQGQQGPARRSAVTFRRQPQKDLVPVELWQDGRYHIGSHITDVSVGTPGMPQTLSQYIRALGGIKDDTGEVRAMIGGITGHGRLINNRSGRTLDDIGEAAFQDGFFSERPSIRELLDRLDDDLRGTPVVRFNDQEGLLALREHQAVMTDLGRLGVDSARTADEVRALMRAERREIPAPPRPPEDLSVYHPTATAKLLNDFALEARGRMQLRGYRDGQPFDDTGRLQPALLEYLRPRLGDEVTDMLAAYSEARANNWATPGLQGTRDSATMLGRAIRDARERGNFPERVREESDAMLSRLYDAVRQDISAAARRAGPEGEAYVRLSERIDSAYRELMRTVRQPLGRVLGENVDPVAAIGQLVRATQEGGEIRLLRAYFRVAREKGNHALATSLLLHDMTEGGLQGFLRTYRGLSEDARRLMFHGSPGAEALGNRLDMLARAGGRLERFIETARPGYVIDPRRWIGTGNIALGLLYHVSLPALITTAVGMSAASRILASRAFGRWLRHLPVERGPLAREWQSYVQRVRAVLLESLGLNTAAANTVVSYLSPASAHALEPAAGREAPPGMRSVVGKKGAETGRGVHRTLGGDIELPPEPESRRFGKGSVQVGPEREPTGQHNFLWRMLTDPGRHFEERVRYYADNPPRGFVENMNATAEMIGHMGFGPFGGVIPGRGVNIETFIRLFREGLSRDELARRFGISRPRVNSIIRERGLHPPLQQRWATPEVIAQLEQMLGEGLSRRSMAERLGTNVNTIDRLLERSELRVPQTRRRVDPATRPQPPRRPRGDEYVATQTRALIAMEDELRRQGKSAAEIARAINERFREGVTADEIASGQVWWRE